MKQTFGKKERLCSHRVIGRLFQRGSTEVQTFYLFPFRVLYIQDQPFSSPLPQVLFSVSKKKFKKAVDRNQVRRRCKEAYRLHKFPLSQVPPGQKPSYIAFLYLAKEIASYDVIEKAMKQCIKKLENLPSYPQKDPSNSTENP